MRVHARGSGLLVAERPAVPRQIAQLLRQVDERLELRQEVDARHRMFVWRVFVAQPDRPSVWVMDWRENPEDTASRPLPLSSGLVEEVSSRRLGSRRRFTDPLAANDRLRAEAEREALEEALTAGEELDRREKRLPVLPRSRSLYLARSRARARGSKI